MRRTTSFHPLGRNRGLSGWTGLIVQQPSTPSVEMRACQRQTQAFDVPVAAMIAFEPAPSALKSTMRTSLRAMLFHCTLESTLERKIEVTTCAPGLRQLWLPPAALRERRAGRSSKRARDAKDDQHSENDWEKAHVGRPLGKSSGEVLGHEIGKIAACRTINSFAVRPLA